MRKWVRFVFICYALFFCTPIITINTVRSENKYCERSETESANEKKNISELCKIEDSRNMRPLRHCGVLTIYARCLFCTFPTEFPYFSFVTHFFYFDFPRTRHLIDNIKFNGESLVQYPHTDDCYVELEPHCWRQNWRLICDFLHFFHCIFHRMHVRLRSHFNYIYT